jgi:hypothetical protein
MAAHNAFLLVFVYSFDLSWAVFIFEKIFFV